MKSFLTVILVMSVAFFCLVLLVHPVGVLAAPSDIPNPDTWVTNGSVEAIAHTDGITYIGGDFDYVGPNTGIGAAISATTADPIPPYTWLTNSSPSIVSIYTVIPDGSGGWYIGGDFNYVCGVERNNIAHILPDGTLDAAWNPNADNHVYALTKSGTVVYAGGQFTNIGGQPRSGIAAIDATTGLATSWDPDMGGGDGYVRAIVVDDGVVYAGGSFNTIGADTRNNIAAIDADTGEATDWDPDVSGYVLALAMGDGVIYVGGQFTHIGVTTTRDNIAAIDTDNGEATDWDPDAGGRVRALAVDTDNGVVYAGGDFTMIGLQTRYRLAAISISTGQPTLWVHDTGGIVYALALDDGVVYVGGSFEQFGTSLMRNNIAAFGTTPGVVIDWDPNAEDDVYALAVDNGVVYAGGRFMSIGGETRNNIAAINTDTGEATAWDPDANNTVRALAADDGVVYAGGLFTEIGGQPRNRIACLDATGAATSWDPNANLYVDALAVGDGVVYAGGYFSMIGDDERNHLAAIDTTTGLATSWDPNANNTVRTLAMGEGVVYAGGTFTSINDEPHNYLVALDATSGIPIAWDPNANLYVFALAVGDGAVYAGGLFSEIGGQPRNYIARIDASTGNATDWNPDADNTVYALAIGDGVVYAGGNFISIGREARNHLACLDANGYATAWNPNANELGFVEALAATDDVVYVGGYFTEIGGASQPHFAQFDEYINYFCVSNETELQDALTAAQENEADDTIRVVQGLYNGNFIYDSSEGYGITLEGGYTTGCAGRIPDPVNTILDGDNDGRVLTLNTADGGDIAVNGFTVQQGNAATEATPNGGGICATAYSDTRTSGTITLANNILTGSTATWNGGGIYARAESASGTAGDIVLTSNTVTNNVVTGTGGGPGSGGGICVTSYSNSGNSGDIILTNNTVTGNTAELYGGGIIAYSYSITGTEGVVTLTNNTITGNTSDTQGGGASLPMWGGEFNVYNNIIRGNTAPVGGDIYIDSHGTYNGYNNDYSSISGSWTDEGGNINADPLFVNDSDPDPVNWDLHLTQSSPCIDAGTAAAPELPDTDFEGDARIINGAPDMGADEVGSFVAAKTYNLCPGLLGFGPVETTGSRQMSFTIINPHESDLEIYTITGPSSPFTKTVDECNETTLAPRGRCTITVEFTPSTEDTFSDSLIIPTNDPQAGTATVSLAGTGVSAGESAFDQAADHGVPVLSDLKRPSLDRAPGDAASRDESGEVVQIPEDAQSHILESLARSPKLIHPERVLDAFIAGEPTTRVIVNLARPQNAQSHTHFKDKAARDERRQAVRALQDTVINRTHPSRVRVTNRFTYVSGFSAEVTPEGLQELTTMDDVLSVNEDRILEAHLAQGIPLMNAATVRDTYNGTGLSIAICDTGIDYTHPMLGGGGFPNTKVIGGRDTGQDDDDPMDGHGHGTCCAGIAAGDLGTVGDYIGGVAHNAKLYALKVTYNATGGSAIESDMIEAWEWCITHQYDDEDNPIMIISTSFGGYRYYDICDALCPLSAEAAANVADAGITLFVSSGNNGFCDSISAPACVSDAISVGSVLDFTQGGSIGWCLNPDETCAVTEDYEWCDPYKIAWQPVVVDTVTRYTNIADILDLLAPSEHATTTDIVGAGGYNTGGDYYVFGGTSAACPYAAGAAACLQSAALAIEGAYLTPAEVRATLTSTGDPITDEKVSITKPRIDLGAAVDTLEEPGLFLPYQTFPVGSCAEAVAIGDVNDDGRNDVVVSTTYVYSDPDNNYRIHVFLQNASGGLESPVKYQTNSSYTSRSESIAIGDLNNDGRADVAVGNAGNNIEVFLQNAAGTLEAGTSYSTVNSKSIKIGDLNNDGLLDVVGIGAATSTADVLLQNAGGTLDTPVTYSVAHGGGEVDVGDVNNDGLTDIIVMTALSSAYDNIGILLQNAEGTFDAPVYYDLGGDEMTMGAAVGDINGDTLHDVCITYGGNQPNAFIGTFLQNGSGTLDPAVSYQSYDIPRPVEIGDVNTDGRNDVVVAHDGWEALGVFLQSAAGALLPYTLYTIPYGNYTPHGLALGDINDDGAIDAAIADCDDGLVVLYNASPAPEEPDLFPSKDYLLCPGLLGFGPVATTGSRQMSFTIINPHESNLEIYTITGPSSPFTKTVDECNETTLAPRGRCTITVEFAPSSEGTVYDSLIIPTNDPQAGTVRVDLSGTGITE